MPHPHLTVENSPADYRWLRFPQPERRNALDLSLLRAVTDSLALKPEVPVVLGSADSRVFCAGAEQSANQSARARVTGAIPTASPGP